MGIRDKAMLVNLSISSWSGSKTDARVSNETAIRHKAKPGAGNYTKKLVDSSLLSDYRSIATQAYHYHHQKTLPWMDGGWRVLPSAIYFEYAEEINQYISTANSVAERIGDRLPAMMEEAKERLGDMYDPADFPTRDQLIGKFDIRIQVMPIPMQDDFRADVGQDESDLIREKVEKQVQESTEAALNEVWERAYNRLNHLYEQLAQDDKRIMQQSFTALKELADELPKFNIFDDPKLNELAEDLSFKLSKYQADTVRNDQSQRSEATKEAKRILGNMQGMFASAA